MKRILQIPKLYLLGACALTTLIASTAIFFAYRHYHKQNVAHAQAQLINGYKLTQAKNYDAALVHLQEAVRLDPDNLNARILLGDLLLKQHKTEQALIHYQAADKFKPNTAAIIYRLAQTEKALDHLDAAFELAQRLVSLAPKSAEAYSFLGDIFCAQHDISNAIASYKKALSCDPSYTRIYKSLGNAYLANGELRNAWAAFEHLNIHYQATPDNPWWNGSNPVGKTILIIDSCGFAYDPKIGGGYGDTFQALRYVKKLKKMGCSIIVEARPELVPLLSLCPYIDTVIAQNAPRPHYDLQTATALLFQNFNVSLDTIAQDAQEIPYLHADPALLSLWKSKLSQNTNLKIGACWSSKQYLWCNSDGIVGPQKNNRTMPAHYFSSLANLPHISVYSLQKTYGENDVANLPIIQFEPDFDQTHGRFMDTVAVMKQLDLIITVDTAIAHLAGALGMPVWLLLPYDSDWRWFADRTDSPWYPTMRLFRQPKAGDWESVINQVHIELQKIITKKIAQNEKHTP